MVTMVLLLWISGRKNRSSFCLCQSWAKLSGRGKNNQQYPDNPIPRTYLRELVSTFPRTGFVTEKGSGRKSTYEEKQIDIL